MFGCVFLEGAAFLLPETYLLKLKAWNQANIQPRS
jgi:hypothetical protein